MRQEEVFSTPIMNAQEEANSNLALVIDSPKTASQRRVPIRRFAPNGNAAVSVTCLSSAQSACGNQAVKTDTPFGEPLTAALSDYM